MRADTARERHRALPPGGESDADAFGAEALPGGLAGINEARGGAAPAFSQARRTFWRATRQCPDAFKQPLWLGAYVTAALAVARARGGPFAWGWAALRLAAAPRAFSVVRWGLGR